MFENDSRGRRAARPDTDDSTRFGGPPFRGRGRGGPWDRGPRGGWGGGRGGGRARRGDVRAAILALLTEKPMHGYEMIQELDERTSGAWKPSPGSVYPTLTMLEDEGLVTAVESDGKRRYTLTDAGTEAAAERQGPAPWEQVVTGANPAMFELKDVLGTTMQAVQQVFRAGTPAQQAKAVEILTDTRRRLYEVLASEED
ncbi:MAG TPA: PadR family transcriptional regulator [Acidimicrobiales bacterium]|nr:PadR family transcriptional regulator [Acidimicrobiales bacterium]